MCAFGKKTISSNTAIWNGFFNSLRAGYLFMLLLFMLLTFFIINFFKKFFQEHYQNVKRFGSLPFRLLVCVCTALSIQPVLPEELYFCLILCMLGNFACLFCCMLNFSKLTFSKKKKKKKNQEYHNSPDEAQILLGLNLLLFTML